MADIGCHNIKLKTPQKILLTFLIFSGLFWSFEALAVSWLPLVPCGREGAPDCNLCHFWQLGSNIINFITLELAVPAAILLFIWAGIMFLFSAGSEERIKTARNIFTNTIIGVVIVFVSWLAIDTFIKRTVGKLTETGQYETPATEAGRAIWAWNAFPACGTSSQ
ncbi:MAG: hypothetical protein A3J64_00065 [Candidatus Portnoybacteria bacterium RIFCSPHIGHO2_12_FULL_38_9]|uniref:Uncharacterized protein n=1 Tax=Candidatus Portnoybacteria bacterium RIFCSPHIGHO2_12_FULL_38_9 TaxID=1801997 RepID=A0A1G2FJD4_9BACT|nr:MAG: hypothetical protein A3J64_00065 [Candidatus Portnoybacteria bacterium RIFCSPHIGHO2_12_FULL_38_9]